MGFYFDNTEGHQEWEVPEDVTDVAFSLWGGGQRYASSGGNLTDLTPGEIIHINIGGNPLNSGWNGGGASVVSGFFSTGGGGATDVRRGGNDIDDRIMVAGGIGGRTVIGTSSFISTAGPSDGPVWYYWYKTIEGYSYYTYPLDPELSGGPVVVPVEQQGPSAGSGSNGADSVTVTQDRWSYLPNPEEISAIETVTFHLGAGGGGWVGGEGGYKKARQADPMRYPTRHEANNWGLDGDSGSNYIATGIGSQYIYGTYEWVDRPDGWPELYYAQRSLPGAIFISWEGDEAGFAGWSTGSVRVGTELGW